MTGVLRGGGGGITVRRSCVCCFQVCRVVLYSVCGSVVVFDSFVAAFVVVASNCCVNIFICFLCCCCFHSLVRSFIKNACLSFIFINVCCSSCCCYFSSILRTNKPLRLCRSFSFGFSVRLSAGSFIHKFNSFIFYLFFVVLFSTLTLIFFCFFLLSDFTFIVS